MSMHGEPYIEAGDSQVMTPLHTSECLQMTDVCKDYGDEHEECVKPGYDPVRPRRSPLLRRRPRPLRRRPTFLLTLSLLTFLCTLLLTSSASAEVPWWNLNTGTRPSYLEAGAGSPEVPEVPGEPEVQEIVAPIAEIANLEVFGKNAGFDLKVKKGSGSEDLGQFITEPLAELLGELEGAKLLDAANLQAALEAPYGTGKVHVTEEAVGETLVFHVESRFGSEPIELGVYFVQPPSTVKVTSAGTKGIPAIPAAPDGELYMTAENVGDAAVGESSSVTFTDVVPKGLEAVSVAGSKPAPEGDFSHREAIPCTLEEHEGTQIAKCTLSEALLPYDQVEMRIGVNVQGAKSGEQNEVAVSGGGAQGATLRRPIVISSDPVPFGLQGGEEGYEMALEEEGGGAPTQAGSHPFQLSTAVTLNQLRDAEPLSDPLDKPEVSAPALAKDLNFKLPPGLIGNPSPIAKCSITQFFERVDAKENRCPPNSAVGVAVTTVHDPATVGTVTVTEPIFNLEPRVGEPARFGFYIVIANAPVFIDTSLRTGSDYGVTVSVQNIPQNVAFLSSNVTFWGVPGDHRHDSQRGWGCIYKTRGGTSAQPCEAQSESHPPPFLVLPTTCEETMRSNLQGDSWSSPGSFFDITKAIPPSAPLENCNRLRFAPEIKVAPDGQEAAKPTGLTVDVHVPQEVNENAQGLASSNVKDITVAFPPGVTVNPAAADGLQACSEQQIGFLGGLGELGEQLFTPTLPQAFCPDAAKIGTVKLISPLLPPGQAVEGALYLATPAPNKEAGKNPFNALVATYIIAKDPISGTLVKLPGQTSLDANTGQVTTTFENNPQVAFEDAEIHLFGGERAPFVTPSRCGLATTTATFTPWSGTPPVSASSSFQVTKGPNGKPCTYPGQSLPFAPTLAAGTSSNNAGSYSPLSTTITREDGEQSIGAVSLHMPTGLSGILNGVALCPEAQANAGSCPQSSLIGHTIVSVGLGSDPFSVQGGEVFLTDSYKGAPFGLSIVNPAVAGPFDLGKVIVRAKVEVDLHTAALTVSTDETGPYAIPHILDGIPLQIKHVNVLIDRPGFIFNPTNCTSQSITGTIQSTEGATAPVQASFLATNCALLKFAPSFKVSTSAKTSKASGASLSVKLTYPKAPQGVYANVAKVKVSLPKQLPSRLTTLQKACTAAVFDANPQSCPKESIVGQAKVKTQLLPVPLTGSAYFVSHGGEAFPDLTIVLKGYGVTVDLVGSTQIKGGVTTTTFKSTPDVPFESFELNLPQGKYSALAANADLCKSKLTMPTEFVAQNGAELHQQTPIAVSGCKKKLTKHQQLLKALAACHKKHGKAKRRACTAQAHRRFGVKKSKKSKKK